jgi:cell division protein FtsN
MARKKAPRKRKSKSKRTAGRRKADKFQGWMGMAMGLTVGLVVAFFVYVSDLKPPPQLKARAQEQAQSAIDAVGDASDSIEAAVVEPVITFDFYEMLPNLDVEVFEDKPRAVAPSKPAAKVTAPGIYILQAGSFTTTDDANRRKAEIALLGVRTEIKRGKVKDRDVYRIYTDPMENPADVNRVSQQLRDAKIEILLKRVSD